MSSRIVALTGSPGTGKSTLAERLAQQGIHVVTVETVAQQVDALHQIENVREIETPKLQTWIWSGAEACVVDGHLSHYCSIDSVMVLRCNPSTLRERLQDRDGYDSRKIETNVEWELLGGVWSELIQLHPKAKVVEFDTTNKEIPIDSVLDFIQNSAHSEPVESAIEDSIDWISLGITAESI